MSASSSPPPSRSVVSSFGLVTSLLVLTLCLAAVFMGAHAIERVFRIFFRGLGKLMLEQPALAAVISTTLLSAFASCFLFLYASRLLLAGHTPIHQKVTPPLAAYLVAVLYTPFFWIVESDLAILSPVLPGFIAGVFTKPMDNKLIFAIVSCMETILIVTSLAVICIRVPRGALFATAIALVISISTSYASYCYMRM